MNDQERLAEIELWRSADPLDFAWFHHAPEELKEQFRESGAHPEQRSYYLRQMMEGEVALRVARGDFIAFGIQISPSVEADPRRMPAYLFDPGAAKIDWDEGTVSGLGRLFNKVGLVSAERIALAGSKAGPTRTALAPAAAPRGRRSYEKLFDEAIKQLLLEEEHFADWPQEQQGWSIRQRVAKLHPGQFRGAAKPGRSTVLRHLRKHPVRAALRPENPENPE